MAEINKNGHVAGVRHQTKDELIENLKDQCKFWRTMWSDQTDAILELETEKDKLFKEVEVLFEALKKIRGQAAELDEN